MTANDVKTIRDLIFWEYAKLIAGTAMGDRKSRAFVSYTYRRLRSGEIKPSSILRENKLLTDDADSCAYCGEGGALQWEHIVPKARGGPDTFDNLVKACRACNLAKGARDPYEWYGAARKNELPRIVLGKLLKLAFLAHEAAGTLDDSCLGPDGKRDVSCLLRAHRAPDGAR